MSSRLLKRARLRRYAHPSSLRRLAAVAFAALALGCAAAPAARAQIVDARALLAEADRARGNYDGVSWHVALEATDGDRTVALTLAVEARGFDFLATALAPPRDRGQKLLLREGNLWFHKPDLSKPVPISQRQRLLGDAAYGDIAATDYASDYDIESCAEERLDGEPCLRLELRARARKATYERIRYWVSLPRRVGVRAEYLTGAGRPLKSAQLEYGNAVDGPDGRRRPFISRMTIRDEILAARVTTLVFSAPVLRPVPPGRLDVNLLTR